MCGFFFKGNFIGHLIRYNQAVSPAMTCFCREDKLYSKKFIFCVKAGMVKML